MSRRLLGPNRERERILQDRLLTGLQRQFTGRIKRQLDAQAREMVTHFARTGGVSPVTDEHERAMAAIYADMAAAGSRVLGSRILDQGKALGYALEVKSFAEMFAMFAADYISQEMVRRRIVRVTQTTRDTIVNAIARTTADGTSIVATAREISRVVGGINAMRADRIARTETHGAANYGADRAARATGLELQKEWVAVEDARTRPDHAEADGATVEMDQAFTIGGEALMFPGDFSAPAEQVINCRCQVAHIVND